MSDYIIRNGTLMSAELYHHGVKGMKWGVRKKRANHNKDYSDKQRKQDRAFYGKGGEKRVNKKMNEGYGLRGARHFEAERKERNDKRKKIAKKAAKITASALGTVGMMYVRDQAFNDGRGTKAAKAAIKHVGRAVVTAYTKARGGYDIHWYDN